MPALKCFFKASVFANGDHQLLRIRSTRRNPINKKKVLLKMTSLGAPSLVFSSSSQLDFL